MASEKININISGDISPIADGIKNNLNAIPKGTRKLFQILFGKKYADVLRYQMLQAAQTKEDIIKISSGKYIMKNGEVIPSKNDQISTDQNLHPIMQRKLEEESNNLEECMRFALYDSLYRNDEADSIPISEKFFSRWRNEAIHISDREEQELWGKILSEESQHHGSFRLSTIDILRNLEREHAELFSEVCKYVVFEEYVLLDDNYGIGKEITTQSLVALAELGLITISIPVHTANYFPTMKIDGQDVLYIDKHPYIIFTNNIGKFSFYYAKLTTAGKELYKIATNTNDDIIINMCTYLLQMKCFSGMKKISYSKYKVPIINNYFHLLEVHDVIKSK